MSVSDIVAAIPARRWMAIRRALDMTVEEITSDPIAIMVAACNEKHRAETGRDAWDRYLDMTLSGLSEELSDDDPKSDDEPSS